MRRVGGVLAVAMLAALWAERGQAQDTIPAIRHLLPLDISRVQPFRHLYDVIVHSRDSTFVIGQREVSLSASSYGGAPAWLLVETRTGLVPAAESLYLASDLRPIHWSATTGPARLALEFVGDSIYGATSAPIGKQSIVLAGRPDLVITGPMLEALLPLLPLSSTWADSVGILTVDLTAATVLPAEVIVIGEEDLLTDSASRPVWVVVLRAGPWHALHWIDKETGTALRIERPLPAHAGTLLEYRFRSSAESASPSP